MGWPLSHTPTVQPGAGCSQGCPSAPAVCGDSCLSHNRKRKGKESFLRMSWPFILREQKLVNAKHSASSNTMECPPPVRSDLPPTTPWQSGQSGGAGGNWPEGHNHSRTSGDGHQETIFTEGSGWGTLHSLYWKVLE